MGDEPPAGDPEHLSGPAPLASSPASPTPPARRRRRLSVLILAAGGLLAAYVASRGPREQHIRVVLGDGAATVTALEVSYLGADGEVARESRMVFDARPAPRIVAHELSLPDGDYRLRIAIDTREGRRSVERQVSLSGGTTQVDVSTALSGTP